MNRKYTSVLFLAMAMLLLLKSCLKDDLSHCPVKLQVYFESVMPAYKYEDITYRLDLYLYDGMDLLTETYSYSKEELKAINYRPTLPLGDCDRYTLLALVNMEEEHYTLENETLESFKVALKSTNNDTVYKKQTNLFFAGKELPKTTSSKNENTISETLLLYKNTNHIFINLSFESPPNVQKTALHAYIQGNNGSFNHRNKCHPISKRVYMPHDIVYDTKDVDIQYQFTTMHLWFESDLELLLQESKQERLKLRIMEYISRIYDTPEMLDKEDTFYIDLILKDDFTILELIINGWHIIRSGVEV